MDYFSEKLKKAYNSFYDSDMWQSSKDGFKSGSGSSIEYTQIYSENLTKIIKKYEIKKIFDCSCGDWFWMQHIKENFENYVGNDVCQKLIQENKEKYTSKNIKFTCNDMLSQMKLHKDLEFDLVICRHTFEHLPIEYNIKSIWEMKRISKYAIITSANLPYSLNEDPEIIFKENFHPPYKSVNLDLEPYVRILPNPIEKFLDFTNTPEFINYDVSENKSLVGTFGYMYEFN